VLLQVHLHHNDEGHLRMSFGCLSLQASRRQILSESAAGTLTGRKAPQTSTSISSFSGCPINSRPSAF
jgi:hypothetical protein